MYVHLYFKGYGIYLFSTITATASVYVRLLMSEVSLCIVGQYTAWTICLIRNSDSNYFFQID